MKLHQFISRRQLLLLLGLVLVAVPLLLIYIDQLEDIDESMTVIQESLERQSSAILFSINQSCWDVTVDQLRRISPQIGTPKGLNNGYQKIQLSEMRNDVEPLSQGGSANRPQVFLWNRPEGSWIILSQNGQDGISFNTEWFIQNELPPFLSLAAGDAFILKVLQINSGQVLVSTSIEPGVFSVSKAFWLFPGYEIEISLQAAVTNKLVDRQSKRLIINLAVILLTLGAGIWVFYRNYLQQVRLSAMQADFVANVTHELKTPLALIRMYAESIELGRIGSEEKRTSYLQTIQSEVDRLSSLIEGILLFSKLETGKKKFDMMEVNLGVLIKEVIKQFTPLLTKQRFDINVDCSDDFYIQADRDSIKQVLVNLIDNAIKYSENEKFLGISARKVGEQVVVEVADHGMGIEQHELRHIFEKFYRIEGSLTHKTRGTGLGLSTVKQILDAHEASIEVNSEPARGSTFTLTFNAYNNEENPGN